MVFEMSSSQIRDNLRIGKIKISVIGLGQVGLPMALHFAKEGVSVIGVDNDEEKVKSLKQGVCPLSVDPVIQMFNRFRNNLEFTSKITEAVKNSHIHILCLPTPLGSKKLPDLSMVVAASESVGKGLKEKDLVIVESTVYPGVTNRIIKPALEKSSGLTAGKDFGLAYCFERIDPGNVAHRIDNSPKVIGATDERSANAAAAIYGMIVKAPIVKVRNCETAELVKLVENTYRDINIAFVNEIALLCEGLNIDVLEVLDAASTKWSFTPHVPGAGVGGMCIPVNPYYLLESAREVGLQLKLVQQAREINEGMPHHMVELVREALDRIKKPLNESKVCILGLAYKADIDDTRGAPAEEIAKELEKLGAEVVCHDPVVATAPQGINFESSFEKAITGSDCIVITTAHSSFRWFNLQTIAGLAHNPLAIVDGRHILVPGEVEALGITYMGLGRIRDSNLNIWNSRLTTEGQQEVKHGTI